MKTKFYILSQKTQKFLLRLFIESDPFDSTPSFYTCAHAGTHTRLHQ